MNAKKPVRLSVTIPQDVWDGALAAWERETGAKRTQMNKTAFIRELLRTYTSVMRDNRSCSTQQDYEDRGKEMVAVAGAGFGNFVMELEHLVHRHLVLEGPPNTLKINPVVWNHMMSMIRPQGTPENQTPGLFQSSVGLLDVVEDPEEPRFSVSYVPENIYYT